ncbi:MAG TPA: cation diffusion facilitator family transporter [Nocardioidaceae bacterium]|nr:cation diffusion facilitator family transporter [Nocardioidaceae bacterium]
MTGHSHTAATGPGSAGSRNLPRLRAAFGLTMTFLLLELVTAVAIGSLALLSDAGHMATDVAGLGMALAAITVANRARSAAHHTFGWYRLEILAALANAALLVAVAVYVLVEAVGRFSDPVDVPAIPLLGVAAAGLVANLVAFWLLRGGAEESLNVRGAYLEVLADLVSSVGVIIGAVVMLATGWRWVDPAIGVAVGLFVVPRALRLGGQALRILLQAAPPDVDVDALTTDLGTLDGVVEVHDVHVWTLTSQMDVASAHLSVANGTNQHGVLDRARVLLTERYGIDHATLQVEPEDHTGCAELGW